MLQRHHTKEINFQQLLLDFSWNQTDPACRYRDSPLFEWLKTGGSSQRCKQWVSSSRNREWRDITDLLFTNIQHLNKRRNTKSIQCMWTLSLYNQSFFLNNYHNLQKKSHYIISLKLYIAKKNRCNNCSIYLRATWFLSRLLVIGHLM